MKLLTKKNISSFTIIEILVVITIIILLAGVGAISYAALNKNARDGRRKTDLENLKAALEMYRSNVGTYVTTTWSNLSVLTGTPKYIQSLPADPKSPSYSYNYSSASPGSDYTIGAYLEGSSSTCSVTLSCTVANCNYCIGPYGQK